MGELGDGAEVGEERVPDEFVVRGEAGCGRDDEEGMVHLEDEEAAFVVGTEARWVPGLGGDGTRAVGGFPGREAAEKP